MLLVLRGVCDLCCETRGGQYFAAEGREIEGPPPSLRMFLAASLIFHNQFVHKTLDSLYQLVYILQDDIPERMAMQVLPIQGMFIVVRSPN